MDICSRNLANNPQFSVSQDYASKNKEVCARAGGGGGRLVAGSVWLTCFTQTGSSSFPRRIPKSTGFGGGGDLTRHRVSVVNLLESDTSQEAVFHTTDAYQQTCGGGKGVDSRGSVQQSYTSRCQGGMQSQFSVLQICSDRKKVGDREMKRIDSLGSV